MDLSRIALPTAVMALLLLAPRSVLAQATNTASATGTAGAGSTGASGGGEIQATLRTEGGRRVYVATGTIEVRGEIQRPYAFSLSGRSSLGYTYVEVPVHFVQEILNVVRRAPF